MGKKAVKAARRVVSNLSGIDYEQNPFTSDGVIIHIDDKAYLLFDNSDQLTPVDYLNKWLDV